MSSAQRRAQAVRLGALIAELEKTLQNQSCSEKELRALDHQILHLATILKVPVCIPTRTQTYCVCDPCAIYLYVYVYMCSLTERPFPAEKLIIRGDSGCGGSPGQL